MNGREKICGKSRNGKFLIHRKNRRDRVQAKLTEVKEELRRRMPPLVKIACGSVVAALGAGRSYRSSGRSRERD